MRSLYFTIITCIAILASGCSVEPVEVVIDRSAEDGVASTIVIDGKVTLHFKGDSTTAIQLEPGNHYVQVNDSTRQEFNVTSKGGILNLSNNDYVIFDVRYTDDKKKKLDIDMMRQRSSVLIDSFLVVPKQYRKPSNAQLKNIVEKLQRNDLSQNSDGEPYRSGLKKVGKGQLFIPKTWDYNMTDSIPEVLSVEAGGKNSHTIALRKTILREKLFLYNILFSDQEEYTVLTLKEIREGKDADTEKAGEKNDAERINEVIKKKK